MFAADYFGFLMPVKPEGLKGNSVHFHFLREINPKLSPQL